MYGTLMRGEKNHGELAGATFLGEAATAGGYALHDMGTWPALVEGGRQSVPGELFEVDDALLARLDEFETSAAFYRDAIRLENSPPAQGWLMRAEGTTGRPLIPRWSREFPGPGGRKPDAGS